VIKNVKQATTSAGIQILTNIGRLSLISITLVWFRLVDLVKTGHVASAWTKKVEGQKNKGLTKDRLCLCHLTGDNVQIESKKVTGFSTFPRARKVNILLRRRRGFLRTRKSTPWSGLARWASRSEAAKKVPIARRYLQRPRASSHLIFTFVLTHSNCHVVTRDSLSNQFPLYMKLRRPLSC
jgi:hypothetical protein